MSQSLASILMSLRDSIHYPTLLPGYRGNHEARQILMLVHPAIIRKTRPKLATIIPLTRGSDLFETSCKPFVHLGACQQAELLHCFLLPNFSKCFKNPSLSVTFQMFGFNSAVLRRPASKFPLEHVGLKVSVKEAFRIKRQRRKTIVQKCVEDIRSRPYLGTCLLRDGQRGREETPLPESNLSPFSEVAAVLVVSHHSSQCLAGLCA